MDELRDLLDRQIAALESQDTSADFLVSVAVFLRALEGEPRIAIHLADLRAEAVAHVEVLAELEETLLPTVVDLRQRLSQLSGALSGVAETSDDAADSLSDFDAIAQAPIEPMNYRADGARCGRLLAMLQSIQPSGPEDTTEREQWNVDLYNAQVRWDHAAQRLALEMRVSAGLALLRLESIPPALNPLPEFRQVGEDRRARIDRQIRHAISTEQHLFYAVHLGNQPPPYDTFVADRVQELRGALSRLGVELHRRLGTTRSRQALILRFKQRAEWHDAARLRMIASEPDAGSGHPEDRLTSELARFLFDQGLNPLTKPIAGGLQPDLLDPAATPVFYVEAKQYNRSDRRGIIGALRQVLDTVGRLRGDSLPITEAFCVVFRRDGPRYLLPEVVEAEGYHVYFTLIDIAPAAVSGRRQRHAPSQITVADLVDLPPAANGTDAGER